MTKYRIIRTDNKILSPSLFTLHSLLSINPNIFRAYDIRGIVPTDITPEFALNLGKAFGTYLRRQAELISPARGDVTTKGSDRGVNIAVSRDNRPHGLSLKMSFEKGLILTGCNVIDLGELPSPMLYFATCHLHLDAGVSITASHNPAEYNGFKFVGKNAHSIHGDEIQKILSILQSGNFAVGTGEVKDHDSIRSDYQDYFANRVDLSPLQGEMSLKEFGGVTEGLEGSLSIVIDAANGIAGEIYPQLFESLGCTVHRLYCESDGTFPNHAPDPVIESNLTDLKAAVLKHKADFGLSFDGDGDRVALVDEKGNYHDANETLVILAKDLLSRHPKSSVVYTVSCSLIVPQEIKRLGGKSHMVPVGHSHVEEAMNTHKAILGGEQSGHFFVAENYFGFDDACYTALKLTQIFSKSSLSVSQLYAELPSVVYEPEYRPFCEDNRKFEVINRITRKLEKHYPCITIDGVRADMGKGSWVGIRASNTSPCISVCIEAESRETLHEIKAKVQDLLREEGIE